MDYVINKINNFLDSEQLDCNVTECNGQISITDFSSTFEFKKVKSFLKGYIFTQFEENKIISIQL